VGEGKGVDERVERGGWKGERKGGWTRERKGGRVKGRSRFEPRTESGDLCFMGGITWNYVGLRGRRDWMDDYSLAVGS